jgi:TolB protein
MNANGEAVRQVTDFGYHPAWSPDGRKLLCTEESITTPADRTINMRRLWEVEVATGQKRLVSTEDIAQPQWSPHGQRIAYWGSHVNAQRDILTMLPQGGTPTPVTNDDALDWNPVWSPDGRYLYFSSDRSGRMQLWRVAIDEASGKVLSSPEPALLPTEADQQMVAFTRNGQRMAYVTAARTKNNLHRLGFDPEQGVAVGAPLRLTQDSQWLTDSDLSPDGQWLVCTSTIGQQEDLYILRSVGSGERRRLTNDPAKDREPSWSPDGKQIAFHSNQSGAWEIWLINADGSGRRQLTYTAQENAFVPVWSPDGARIVYTTRHGIPYAIEVARPWWEQTPQPIGSMDTRYSFLPAAWSADGTQLAGPWRAVANGPSVIGTYSFKTQQFATLVDGRGVYPVWLNDNRRVLFFRAGKIFLSDPITRQAQQIFSAEPHRITSFALSRDNRTIYFTPEENDADLWMLDRQ